MVAHPTMWTGYFSLNVQVLYMVRIYRFAGIRPDPSIASIIAAVPYDVVTAEEVRAITAKNPGTFLRVSRSDAELPELAPDDDRVYQRARENFVALESTRRMKQDPTPGMYLYLVSQEGEIFQRSSTIFWIILTVYHPMVTNTTNPGFIFIVIVIVMPNYITLSLRTLGRKCLMQFSANSSPQG